MRARPSTNLSATLRRTLAACIAAALAACTGLPASHEGAPSTTRTGPDDSPLAQMIAASGLQPQRSGFQPMPLSGLALRMRLLLIEQARTSIDIQTFQLGDDATGHQLLRALDDAAARGVRVRLLLDDFHTAGMTDLLLAAAARPGFELRLYNPFAVGRDDPAARLLALLTDFERLNRRMHNKLFVADGRLAIVGGRNLADEYFMRGEQANFIDLDLLCAGPVVAELAGHFDTYWNSPYAYPVQALADNGLPRHRQRDAFDRLTLASPARAAPPPPAAAAAQVLALREGRIELVEGEAAVYFDSPAKTGGGPPPAVLPIASQFGRARSSVLLVSPYFLPSASGLERMRAARARGVDIQVITNAVVDSDEPLVGMAYSARRAEMLRMGVRLYELSSDQLKRDGPLKAALGIGTGRLHMKLALLDEETLFVGSFNLDPRSAGTNTEMAVRVRSQALARRVLDDLRVVRQAGLLQLRLADDGRTVEWLDADGRVVERGPAEPGLDGWQQLRLKLLLWLVPEDLL